MDIFGIKKFLLKALLIVAGAVVLICVCNGCVPEKAALTQKEVNTSSNDSINYTGVPGVVDPVELMRAKAEEKKMLIDATEMKYRILAVGLVVGAFGGIVLMWWNKRALLKRSPLDDYRKERVRFE